MIVITGAAGFIGSNLVAYLNAKGIDKLILVDGPLSEAKAPNLHGCKYYLYLGRDEFLQQFSALTDDIEFVFHLGARTDTTLMDVAEFDKWNVRYSQSIWQLCTQYQVPLVYASSAATYGLGEQGFGDDESLIPLLKPLNPYADSKQIFDVWVLKQDEKPPFWAGLKFFNVYGPREYHKGRMASVVFHAYQQIKATGKMKLFRSHHPDYKDGGQLRDFIYVNDLLAFLYFLYQHPTTQSGIYNLGTGTARTFKDLALATFSALNVPPNIEYIDTPLDIRDKYQHYTQATIEKLRATGFDAPFTDLEAGVMDYVAQMDKFYSSSSGANSR